MDIWALLNILGVIFGVASLIYAYYVHNKTKDGGRLRYYRITDRPFRDFNFESLKVEGVDGVNPEAVSTVYFNIKYTSNKSLRRDALRKPISFAAREGEGLKIVEARLEQRDVPIEAGVTMLKRTVDTNYLGIS